MPVVKSSRWGSLSRIAGSAMWATLVLALCIRLCEGQDASEVIKAAGVEGGLVVHVGTTDGQLEASLAHKPSLLIHGLSTNTDAIAAARQKIDAQRLWGRVCVEPMGSLRRLPHAADLVNLLVADLDAFGGDAPSADEITRVLAPGGDTLLVAGGTPVGPIHRGGELRMISMSNGRDRAVAKLPAAAIFDGIAAAYGRIFISTVDGQVVCLGDAKSTN